MHLYLQKINRTPNELESQELESKRFFNEITIQDFPIRIAKVYPQTQIQLFIVHQIHNILKYFPKKDKKGFKADLKLVDTTLNKEEGLDI